MDSGLQSSLVVRYRPIRRKNGSDFESCFRHRELRTCYDLAKRFCAAAKRQLGSVEH